MSAPRFSISWMADWSITPHLLYDAPTQEFSKNPYQGGALKKGGRGWRDRPDWTATAQIRGIPDHAAGSPLVLSGGANLRGVDPVWSKNSAEPQVRRSWPVGIGNEPLSRATTTVRKPERAQQQRMMSPAALGSGNRSRHPHTLRAATPPGAGNHFGT